MRVLHLLAGTGWGGAELMGCTLHQLTCAHGHESRIDGPAFPDIVAGVRATLATSLDGTGETNTWRWVRGARARRKAFQPDIVHAHLATPRLASAVWGIAGSTPLALTFHLLPAAKRWPSDALLRLPSPWVLRALRRGRCTFVVVGRADRERLQCRFPGAPIALAPNTTHLQPMAAGGVLPYPHDAGTKLLSVGRLVAQKGFDRMLEALAAPSLRALRWHWLLVGEGDARAELTSRIAARGLADKVQLLGAQPSRGLYEQADLVLSPSRNEAAPLVPREAIAARVPVLLSAIDAHRELTSGAGLLPEREEDWPHALRELLTSAAARGALRDRQRATDVDRSAELWSACSAVYSQLLETRSHA